MNFNTSEIITSLSDTYCEISDKFISIDRPKFYGQYLISISLVEDLSNWHNYYENKEEIHRLIGMNGLVSGSKHLLTTYCFINDLKLLKLILDYCSEKSIIVQSVKIVSDRFKNIILKRNKYEPKGPWFGKFTYRIRLNKPYLSYKKELKNILSNMNGQLLTSYNNPSLIYLDNVNDVLLLKILIPNEIIEIYDYAVVRP